MSAHIHPRELGVTLRCDYHGCSAAITTAVIRVRAYARSQGWIRGLDPGSGSPKTGGRPANGRWDICPTHAVEERERAAARKTASDARKAERARPPTPEVLAARAKRRRDKANAAAKVRRDRRKAARAKHAAALTQQVSP